MPVDDISRPIVAAHDAHVTVLPGQLERVGDLVHVRLEERQSDAGSVSLRVVVVNEDERIESVHLSPTFTVLTQIREFLAVILAHDFGDLSSVTEFRHSSDGRVFVNGDRTSSIVDDLSRYTAKTNIRYRDRL